MTRVQENINKTLFRKYFPLYTYKYDFGQVEELKQSVDVLKTQVEIYRTLSYTSNEINKKLDLGMEDIKDPVGDMRLIPSNLIPADAIEPVEEPQSKSSMKLIKVEDRERVLLEYFEDKSSLSSDKYNFLRKQQKLFRESVKRMTGKLGKFFSSELGQIIKIILEEDYKSAAAIMDINVILAKIMNTINKNKTELQLVMEPLYREASLGADTLARSVLKDDSLGIVSEEIVASLTNKITDISNYTYKLVRNQIKDGINEGETINQISKRVQKVYKFNSARARTIARTESGSVIHQTTDQRYKEAGVQKKEWITAHDDKVRERHTSNASQGVIPYDQPFNNGQMFPNDGAGSASDNINCRCSYIGIMD